MLLMFTTPMANGIENNTAMQEIKKRNRKKYNTSLQSTHKTSDKKMIDPERKQMEEKKKQHHKIYSLSVTKIFINEANNSNSKLICVEKLQGNLSKTHQ